MNNKELKIFLLCLIPIIIVMFLHYQYTGFVIYNDGINYYNYLRSGIIDGDLNFENEWQFYNQSYSKYSNESRGLNYIEVRTPNGYLDNIHLIGNAILWLPFFMGAHILSLIFGIQANGYTFLYEGSIGLATIVYGFLGMLLIYRFCKKFYSEKISMIATIGVWYGTSAFWYFAVEPSMSHINSLFLVALFVNVWYDTRKERKEWQWIGLGALLGLIYLVRQQDIIVGLLVIFESLKNPFEDFWREFKQSALFGIGFLLAILPQIMVWIEMYGQPIVFSYGNYANQTGLWHWTFPQIIPFFFSSDYGMIFNAGLLFVGLIWLIALALQKRDMYISFLVIVCLQIIITSAWSSWTSGFGLRFLLGMSIFFALGLCEGIKEFKVKFFLHHPFEYVIIVTLILANFLNMWSFL